MTDKAQHLIAVIVLLLVGLISNAQNYTLSLIVLTEGTDLPLDNAQIAINPCSCGGVSNEAGRFSIELPQGEYTLTVNYIGFAQEAFNVSLKESKIITVKLRPQEEQLSEVIVRAKQVLDNLESPQMGALELNAQELKKIPAAIGEFDVLRGMTLLAGVNNAGELSNGLSVRGGSLDQNLLLYDYAPVFNPTHLFGLFSVFTPEAVSSVDLYRANIPARFGGRTTSVLDVKVKNPYTNKFKLSGGVGLVSSRLSMETPLIQDKLMVSIGGRVGFTDFLLPLFSERLKNTKANFQDATMKLLYLPSEKDQVSFTGFYTKDFYQLDLITKIQNINSESNQYDFRTLNGTLNWTHSFNNDVNLRNIFVASDYKPRTIFPEQGNDNDIEFVSGINYLSFVSELSNIVNDKVDYYGGVQVNKYTIQPGNLDPGNGNSILPVDLGQENSYVFAGYGNLNWLLGERFKFSAGLRFNHFVFVGPYTQGYFNDITGELVGTTIFEKGAGVKTYNDLEPRLGLNYKVSEVTSIKASYARLNQYLQNVYNSTTPLPTSRWKTSDPNIVPQSSDAFGVGIYTGIEDNTIELGLEGYYRTSDNNLTYKPGADFFLQEYLERDIVQAEGKAYGVELSFRKPKGKFNGWFNYTWSRSLLKSQNEKLADRINNNQWYASDFDRPHVFNGTVNFEGDPYNTWSFNFTAQTGRPYTAANSVFKLEDLDIPIFLERNNARLRPYHRLDFSWKVSYSKKPNRKWKGDWIFTIYNVYGRRNPFNLYYTQRQGPEDANVFLGSPLGSYEISVLNSPLFALTYNFVFE
ncbi:TonB-dependent receptor [Maribacter cobaltidurans]|uniref:TonB-dependent receptor n=1 Tax=Maribacter cobaltidurans TaxID=1178778 RepID=A0A223V259_9FLAO|nr:TonB-dependent receptor [Maribacter cobaltidurans]ASV29513.1 TonB-dependent receptor [Maribacter cobaltidurans]GGD68390.1 collagen-binding protein [Maribacter cobaltidurans]